VKILINSYPIFIQSSGKINLEKISKKLHLFKKKNHIEFLLNSNISSMRQNLTQTGLIMEINPKAGRTRERR